MVGNTVKKDRLRDQDWDLLADPHTKHSNHSQNHPVYKKLARYGVLFRQQYSNKSDVIERESQQ